jgi:hypothetical protein
LLCERLAERSLKTSPNAQSVLPTYLVRERNLDLAIEPARAHQRCATRRKSVVNAASSNPPGLRNHSSAATRHFEEDSATRVSVPGSRTSGRLVAQIIFTLPSASKPDKVVGGSSMAASSGHSRRLQRVRWARAQEGSESAEVRAATHHQAG